ncbi:MAG: glycosyltransferase family 4 protein [Mucilaginibacter polytrichastri]|nr:glycosyltransferase family 4 protein [Mucilaginibacter polytrichastri]
MSARKADILFFTLTTFSTTGGIEKVCRIVCRALQDMRGGGSLTNYHVLSLHDQNSDLQSAYLPKDHFSGCAGKPFRFLRKAMIRARSADILLLSHINLALPALLVQKIYPHLQIVLIAHGVEIWRKQSRWRIHLLRICEKIIAVSHFTKDTISATHGIPPKKIQVLNNCLDPFFERPGSFDKPDYLLRKHKLDGSQPVLFALTRMSAYEQYKGYDRVIEALPDILRSYPGTQYLIGGKCDDAEKERIEALARKTGVKKDVKLIGFIHDHELADYFLLADVFCLPSRKEGFGIVFIEAMACGLPVVAGNKDGSVDTLNNGQFGEAVDPDSVPQISSMVKRHLEQRLVPKKKLSDACYARFNYGRYRQDLENLLLA